MKCFWLFFFIIASRFGITQNFVLKHISVDDGLPSSEVYDMIQDKNGFIWIASDNGLARYDGTKFKVYNSKNGLTDNTILKVLEDNDGTIWTKTIDGKISYVKNDSIIIYNYQVKKPQPSPESIELPEMAGLDTTGKKWIVSNRNSYILQEINNALFKTICYDSTSGPSTTYFIKILSENNFIYSYSYSSDTVADYSIKRRDGFIALHTPTISKLKKHHKIYRLKADKFIGLNNVGHYVIFNEKKILTQGKIDIKNIKMIYEDSYSRIWISNPNGAYLFDSYNLNSTPKHLLKNHYITKVLEDKEGNFWFLDRNEGLFMTLSTQFKFLNFSSTYADKKIVTIKSNQNALWFSSKNGEIWQVDTNLDSKLIYQEKSPPYDFYPFEILDNHTLFLPGSKLYTTEGKLIVNHNSSSTSSYKSITRTPSCLLVGVSNGILKIVMKDNYQFEKTYLNRLQFNERTNAIISDKKNIWIGSVNGLNKLESDSVTSLSKINPLLSNRVMALACFKTDYLILGTRGAGVLIYNKRNNDVKQIDTETGLISDMIKSVFVKKNNIYVGTNKGLSIINIDDNLKIHAIRNFDTKNAFASNEINDINYFNNLIWLATNKGMIYFDEAKLLKKNTAPTIYINYALVKDSLYKPSAISTPLQKNERNIVFHFTDISYKSENRVNYKLYLKGSSQDTLYSKIPKASFTNLEPGAYTFYVWAQRENSIWSEIPAEFNFFIPEKFTETLTFKIGLAILIILMIALLFYWIQYKTKQKHFKNLQTVNLKQQALSALMNPHFIHNSLAAIQHFINNQDFDKSSTYLTQFSNLIRLNLNSIHEGSIVLEDEIERLELYLQIEKMRFGDKLNYHIEVDDKIDIFDIKMPSMLLQPFVENAIQHGILPLNRPGNITIRFKLRINLFLEIFIEDDGVGINSNKNASKNEHHTSISVNLTKERLALISKQSAKECYIKITEVDPAKGEGTIVYLLIPILET